MQVACSISDTDDILLLVFRLQGVELNDRSNTEAMHIEFRNICYLKRKMSIVGHYMYSTWQVLRPLKQKLIEYNYISYVIYYINSPLQMAPAVRRQVRSSCSRSVRCGASSRLVGEPSLARTTPRGRGRRPPGSPSSPSRPRTSSGPARARRTPTTTSELYSFILLLY